MAFIRCQQVPNSFPTGFEIMDSIRSFLLLLSRIFFQKIAFNTYYFSKMVNFRLFELKPHSKMLVWPSYVVSRTGPKLKSESRKISPTDRLECVIRILCAKYLRPAAKTPVERSWLKGGKKSSPYRLKLQ